jgi:diguanylate cyclase (GGDEF)-like protein
VLKLANGVAEVRTNGTERIGASRPMNSANPVTYLTSSYSPWTVFASVLIAMFASYVALDLAKRVRQSDRVLARGWLVGGSMVMGTGIWAMHFVGMLAFKLPLVVGYDYLVTGISWVAAVGVSGVALWVASGDQLTRTRWVGGAMAMGLGICAMHYTGMHAMAMSPGIVWDWLLVGASAVIATVASAVALGIFFWLRERTGLSAFGWQVAASVVMGVAISGMHYTGMAAANFPSDSVCMSWDKLGGNDLGLLVGTVSVVLMVISLFSSVLDTRMHGREQKLSASLAAANQELQLSTSADPLTQLPNRLAFEDRLDGAVIRSQQEQTRVGILFIDLDGFKPVNSSYGHAAGDAVLREVALRLKRVARVTDMVARVGADEFLMMLDGHPDRASAAQVAQRIRDTLREPLEVDGHEIALSCSIGIVLFPEHGPRGKLIANADAAMNAAKRAGGSGHCFFEPYMDASSPEQIDLQRDLRAAIARNELELFFQPKINGKSGQITGVEALLRWRHPARGMISPGVFIPLAERFGIIGALGNWVIEDACRQIRAWLDSGMRLRVAINLSVHQLRQNDLDKRVKDALARHRVDPHLVTFEITESVAMEDTESSMRAFERLSAIGVQLSIDDFGTGYSSLAYLRKLPARQLKIDRSFVMDLEQSEDARSIVEAVVRLAHALDLRVVAEGVETAGQRDILQGMECDELQGFLFAKPMPAKSITLWAMGDEQDAVGRAATGSEAVSFSDSMFEVDRNEPYEPTEPMPIGGTKGDK